MRKSSCVLAVFLFFTPFWAADAEEVESAIIRYTELPPFTKGQTVEKPWAKADCLTRFIIPAQASPAFFQSEARFLFDAENLYLSIKAQHQEIVIDAGERSVFADNNFEIFLRPDLDSDNYYQIAISAGGKIYTGQKRRQQELAGINFTTKMEKEYWQLNVTIPLKTVQLQAPEIGKEKKIAFNICRNNIFMPEKQPEVSSFAVLDSFDYHIADVWETAILRREQGQSRQIVAASRGINVNLFANPDFKLAQDNHPLGWGLHGAEVFYQETAPLSGEWMVRATGNSYHFLTRGIRLKAGKTYTLKVKSRCFGPEGSLGIIQMVREAGRTREGTYSAWQIPLTSEFHEFFFPLKADAGAVSLAFYRIGSRGVDRGVDLAAVHLYEGEISSFEIRKISRTGNKKLVAGTTPVLKTNFLGMKSVRIRVLAIMASLGSTREALEIFAGLPVDLDILTTTGKNQDVYYTDNEPLQIKKHLQENAYDLYMIGNQIPDRIGKELASMIQGNIRKGAGLWLNDLQVSGTWRDLVKEYPAAAVTDTHYLKQALPLELMTLPITTAKNKTTPLSEIREAKISSGRGRIILSDTSIQRSQFKIKQASETYSYATFPYDQFADAWLARMAYYSAGATDSPIEQVLANAGKVLVSGRNWPADGQLAWSLIDKNGSLVAEGKAALAGTQAEIVLPKLTLTGNHVLAVWLQNASGAVLDYNCTVIQQSGPYLSDFIDQQQYYAGNDAGKFQVAIENYRDGLELHWALEDFSGRVLETGGQLTAQKKLEFSVPLRAVYTNLARLWLELRQKDQIIDKQRFPVYIQDRDKARLWSDFTPSVWNAGSETSMDACTAIDRQMENIGIRSYLLPLQGGAAVLNAGMGLGGMYLGGGDYFCALYPPVDNVRRPSLNTAKAQANIAANAEKSAREQRIWGVVHTAVCDEPNLSHPGSNYEVDAHPENILEYQKRMQQKYGSIEKFNQQCDTQYQSFSELKQVLTQEARQRDNFAEFTEWRNFNVDRWVETIRLVADSGKKGDPGSALSLYNSFGQGALSGNDYWKLLTRGGLEFSHEYTSMVYMGNNPIYDFDELYRSFRPDLRVWGFTGYFGSRPRAFFEPWWFALHRYGGFCWFATASGIGAGGGGRWLNLLDVPGYGLTEDAANVKAGLEKSALMEGLGKLFLEYEWQKRDVAILYSHPSLMVSFCLSKETRGTEIHASGKLHDYFYSRHNLRYLLEELLYQYDFIAPEQISQGILDSYKVLFLPGSIALSENTALVLKNFAANGGRIISDFQPGIYDELGRRRSTPASQAWPEKQLTIINKIFNDKDLTQKQQIQLLLQQADSQPILKCLDVEKFSGREAMHFSNDNMHVYAILRNFTRGSDAEEQEFTLPTSGYLYDLREGSCLGKTNRFSYQVPNGEAAIFGHYPYQVEALEIKAPATVQAGSDLKAQIRIKISTGANAGKHVFHVELLPPSGLSRFFLQRNLVAPAGKLDFTFRMAVNDTPGNWRLRVKDVLSGMSNEQQFVLK